MSESKTQKQPQKREPKDLESAIRELVLSKDRRYELAAYLFLYESLAYTQKALGRDDPKMDASQRHVTGQELLSGIHDYAASQYGPLSPTVFRSWGLRRAEDFGEMVFNLVENGLLGKTENDRREDFSNGFDFDSSFEEVPQKVAPR